jgi:RND family efflux transporter MFP subunit
MKRQLIWSVLLLGGAIAITAIMIALRPTPEEQEQVATVPLVQVASYSVAGGTIEVLGSGTVQPREEVQIGAEVSGKLVYVNPQFQEGSRIAGGTLLFRVDQSDYRNRVRSAQADVAAQEVAVLQAREEMKIAQEELRRFSEREAGRTSLARAVDNNDYAARILPPNGAPSIAQAPRPVAPNQLATREPQLRSAEAARDRALAQLADAELALSRTEVRAPFAGLVRSENIAAGTLVQPGQAIGSIVATDAFEVRISLTEDEATLIPGLFASQRGRIPAQVYFDYGDETHVWGAHVDRADAILDAETRTIDVFLLVPGPMRASNPLLLGSFVRATIAGASQSPFTSIPIAALRPDNQVWIVRDNKLQIVPVHVIQRSDTIAYVSAAELGQGGQVVTSQLRTPVTGMDVRVNAPEEAAADE